MEMEFIGVYSRILQRTRTYFYVWKRGASYSVQRLDKQFNPVDIRKTIDGRNFHTLFTHEPEMKNKPGSVKLDTAQKVKEMPKGSQVEDTLREHFRKAMVKLRRSGGKESALQAIHTLMEVEEGITAEHKHMFMDFGVDMRKNELLEEALAFCNRSITLAPNDDHIHFNTARVLMDMRRYDEAEQHILTAQLINDNKIYQKTLEHIERMRMQPMDVDTLKQLLDDEF